MAKLIITLKRSIIGRPEKHRRTVDALGLGKVNSKVEQEDTPQVRGMIRQVVHLIEVEEKA